MKNYRVLMLQKTERLNILIVSCVKESRWINQKMLKLSKIL